MKRAIAFALLSFAGIAAACADADAPAAGPFPTEDASVPAPPVDATVAETSVDAAAPDADPTPPETCTEDGWCAIALPDAQIIGLSSYRISGLAMDDAGVWATTTSFLLATGESTSHLLRYEQGVWKSMFGIGPQQAGPFAFNLNAIAGNGAGTFLAVGSPAAFGALGPVVLRIENGVVTAEYPPDLHGFVAVTFTSATDVWALDDQGDVYRSSTTARPLEWTLEPTLHPPNPDSFQLGPKALFVTATGTLATAGRVNSRWGDDGLIPGYTYIDRRSADGTWTTSTSPSDLDVQSGFAATPDSLWLAAQDHLLNAEASADAGPDAGGLAWAPPSNKLPVYPNALWARNASEVWAVGAVGRIYRWDGATWTDAKLVLNGAPLTTNWLFAITGTASGEMWLGGDKVAVHYTPKAKP